jgi:hypothetical protein
MAAALQVPGNPRLADDVHTRMAKRILLALFVLMSVRAHGQSAAKVPADDKLFETIAKLDTEVFNAFNRCQLDLLGSYFSEDLEFYHDDDGLTRGRKHLEDSVKKYICGKVARDLVPGTLEVYPLHGFGAVEIGVHRFRHPGKDDTEPLGEAKFIHLWRFKDGKWEITRVISFEHHAVK